MTTATHHASPSTTAALTSRSKGSVLTGRIVSAAAALFLACDGISKLLRVAPVLEASEQLGVPAHTLAGIGAVLLVCTAIYAIPNTAVLGAILLTGYLGGATAIHVRAGSGAFPIAFAVGFGVLVWVGLVLREPRLLKAFLARR